MLEFFSIENIAFELLGYPLSYIELIGTFFGLIAVYLASRTNILTWPASIINEFGFFYLFYQVNLYADMLLQVYFFVVTIYGWYFWKYGEVDNKVYRLSKKAILNYLVILILGTIVLGIIISRIHLIFPQVFEIPASYPFPDAFTTVGSILAMILLSKKRIENWLLWMAVDVVAVVVYYLKGIHLVSIEYVVFFLICVFGFFNWKKQLCS